MTEQPAAFTASVWMERSWSIVLTRAYVSGKVLVEGGLMIDLSPMKGCRIDPLHRTARAEPGLTLAEFDHFTEICSCILPCIPFVERSTRTTRTSEVPRFARRRG